MSCKCKPIIINCCSCNEDEENNNGGSQGWSPVLAIVEDGKRRVEQVADWIEGTGEKPPVGQYIGRAGFVDDISKAVDIRGEQGLQGEPGAGGNGQLVLLQNGVNKGWVNSINYIGANISVNDGVGNVQIEANNNSASIWPVGTIVTAAWTEDVKISEAGIFLKCHPTDPQRFSGSDYPELIELNGIRVEEIITPAMTSDTTPEPYLVTYSSSFPGYHFGFYAFDQLDYYGIGTDSWSPNDGTYINSIGNEWVQIKLPERTKILSYAIRSRVDSFDATYAPRNWTLSGSNNGLNWEVIDKQVNQSFMSVYQMLRYNIPESDYQYYRLTVTKSGGGSSVYVGEIMLNGDAYGIVPALPQISGMYQYIKAK